MHVNFERQKLGTCFKREIKYIFGQPLSAPHHSGELSLHEQLRDVEQNENLRRQLWERESQLANCRGQLREKELQEASLHWQLEEKNRHEENLQRQMREMGEQFTHLQGQLRGKKLQEANLSSRLREKEQQEENSEIQSRELEQQVTRLEQQLREKDLELGNSERVSREREQQLTYFQRQLLDKELQETSLHERLREKEQQEENSQRQLREMEQRLTNLQEQLSEKEDESGNLQHQVTALEEQLRTKDQQVNELEISLSTAQQALSQHQRQQSPDWVISRDQIQLTHKLLGRGGWGFVVEGKYCGCAVAVKQIHELILSPHNRNLFEREMDIASRCRHPCLLQFIGATNDEGSPLFLTELMESSLRALLGQRALTATEVSIISLDVARALSYLHQKTPPIIHRDISSANVLLWQQGDQWRGKVSDYGTAKFMQHTMTAAPGSVIYSAPEALTSNQTVKVSSIQFPMKALCVGILKQAVKHQPNSVTRQT